jgi:uncharacterized phage protein gp47/JayE
MTPRKTASEISDLIVAQLETDLSTTIPLLPKSFIRVLAKVLGGVYVLLYHYAGWILLQLFVKTASNEEVVIGGVAITPLKQWGSLVGVFQDEGQRAELEIEVSVLTTGGTLTSGTRFINPNTEIIYISLGDVAKDAATITVPVRATDAGEAGNLDIDAELYFVSPPADCEKTAVVTARTLDGVDAEETEVFRQNIIDRFAARPQGGAYADYRDWAVEVTGVLNAYPYSGGALQYSTGASFYNDTGLHTTDGGVTYPSGAGQVDIFIEAETGVDGIPSSALLEEVWEYIEADDTGLANRRNINAYVNVAAITRRTFDVTITGLAVVDAVATQAAIEAGLEDDFLEREPYILGLNIPPRRDMVSLMDVGGTVGKLAAANGGYVTAVSVSEDGLEDDFFPLQEGEKAKLGTVTWV